MSILVYYKLFSLVKNKKTRRVTMYTKVSRGNREKDLAACRSLLAQSRVELQELPSCRELLSPVPVPSPRHPSPSPRWSQVAIAVAE